MKKVLSNKATALFAKFFIFVNKNINEQYKHKIFLKIKKKKLILYRIKTLSKLETKTSMSLVYEFMYRIKCIVYGNEKTC
jgi:hypothetical protein